MLVQPWFFALIFSEAIENMAGLIIGVMMDRDWVIQVNQYFHFAYLFTYLCIFGYEMSLTSY